MVSKARPVSTTTVSRGGQPCISAQSIAAVSCGADEHFHYENPKALYAEVKKLKRLQKKLSRQEKGSNRRQATKRMIARQHLPGGLRPLRCHT